MKTLLIAGATLALLSSALLEAKQFYEDWNAYPNRNVKAGCISKKEPTEIPCPERITRTEKRCRETSYTHDIKIHLPPHPAFYWLWKYFALRNCRDADVKLENTAAGQIIEVFPRGTKDLMELDFNAQTGWNKIGTEIMNSCPDGHREVCKKVAGRGPEEFLPRWEYSCIRAYQNYDWVEIEEDPLMDPLPVVSDYLLFDECDISKK